MDDEPLARRGIRQLLAAHQDVVVVGECKNGREAVRSITQLKPDLVFLDIQMPGLDGLGVIRVHGQEHMPLIVFVTAHEDFAVDAFDVEATDYLVKPLSDARFKAAMTRVRARLRGQPASQGTITVPTERGELVLRGDDIDWITADDDHVHIQAAGKRYRLRASLTEMEGRLDPARFTRTHRSAIVRLDRVREWQADGAHEAVVLLKDGTRLPLSRRRLAHVKTLLRRSPQR